VRATLAFARHLAQKGAQALPASALDYALAQTFAFSRTALSPTARAEAIAIDFKEGLTPAHMHRFSQELQRLRTDPGLLQQLQDSVPGVVSTLTLSPEHRPLQSATQTLFFVIAPEAQLTELEADIPGQLLPRLWPSDFWLE
jgi:hypothetical protein